jgi:hypothetical protein
VGVNNVNSVPVDFASAPEASDDIKQPPDALYVQTAWSVHNPGLFCCDFAELLLKQSCWPRELGRDDRHSVRLGQGKSLLLYKRSACHGVAARVL